MTKDEALKKALEALLWDWGGKPLPTLELQATNAIKEALAQPEQEPDDLTIAYMTGFHAGKNTPQPKPEQEPVCVAFIRTYVGKDKDGIEIWKDEPLYTTPPQRKPLTDEQIFDLSEPFGAFQYGDAQGHRRREFARAIEAAHGIKGK